MPRNTASAHSSAQQQQDLILDSVGIENFELPKSIVMKIAKSAIPENAKLSKETITALVKGSTVFINYITATAHEVALSRNRKTIAAADILSALQIVLLDIDNEDLEKELQIFRELSKQGGSSSAPARKAGAQKKAAAPSTSASTTSKAKGKAKATEAPPPAVPAQVESISTATAAMAVDSEPELDADEAAEESEQEEEDDEEEEEEDVEEEAVWDTVAAEEEELKKDAKGLDAIPDREVDTTKMVQDT